MKKRLVVTGEPFGKKRPRFRRDVMYVKTYSPKENVAHEKEIKTEYLLQVGNFMFPDNTPIYILIDCYMGMPQKASKKKRSLMLAHEIRPLKKPDWDNVGKTICDSLNGLAYKDDAMVVEGMVRKFYSEEPRTEIVIADSIKDLVEEIENEE